MRDAITKVLSLLPPMIFDIKDSIMQTLKRPINFMLYAHVLVLFNCFAKIAKIAAVCGQIVTDNLR